MPDRSRALLALAFLVLAAAVVRLPLFAALDPLRVAWGSEGGDLAALLAAHDWARSRTDGSLPFGLLTYKPPLYYVGVPWLLSGAERLRWVGLLSVNAAALAVAGAAAAVSARRLAGAPAGALAVLVFCLLPGVEGRFTYAGVEPLQTALLGLALALSIDVLVRGGSVLRGAALGAVCGAGMLVKWTFAFPLLGPAVVAVAVVRDRARIRALLVALVVAASLFLAWALPFLDVSQLVENAPLEGVDDTWGDLASTIGWWLRAGIGAPWGAWLLFLAALPLAGQLAPRRGRGVALRLSSDAPYVRFEAPGPRTAPAPDPLRAPTLVLLSSAASLVAVHLLIPHKEVRYFLPMAWPLATLAGVGLAHVWRGGRAGRVAVSIGLVGMAWTLLVAEPIRERRADPEMQVGAVTRFLPRPPLLPADAFALSCVGRGTNAGLSTPTLSSSPAGIANTLTWWLHQHGPARVAWSGDVRVDALAPGQLAAVDLVVLNRAAEGTEAKLLADGGFSLESTVPWPVGNGEVLRFWCRARPH